MLKNYLLIALRNIGRHRIHSTVNIIGLSIGMAACILITLWVAHERSYDRFHEKSDRIYRIVSCGTKYFIGGYPAIPGQITAAAKEQLPGVVDAVRLNEVPRSVFRYGDRTFYEDNGMFADPSFFEMFSFALVRGDRATVLSDPLGIVVSESMALRYFGGEDPVGKVFEAEGFTLTVTGVAADVPSNSTIRFNYIIPFTFLTQVAGRKDLPWGAFNFSGFVELAGGADPSAVADAMTAIGAENNCPQVADGVRFTLEPLTECHLSGLGSYFAYQQIGSSKLVFAFSLIAFAVLALACINFINLTTARSARRAKEVGLRKVVGAGRKDLAAQFFGESICTSLIALAAAVLLVELMLPHFNRLVGKELTLDYSGPGLVGILALGILTGILSGAYPALMLSSFRPAETLKKTVFPGSGRSNARRALVVTQFALSTMLIAGSITMHEQLKFVHNKDLGFSKENVVYVPVKEKIGARYDYVKESLLSDPNIISVSAQNTLNAFRTYRNTAYEWEGMAPGSQIDMLISEVDFDFFETLRVPVTAGRTFSRDYPADAEASFVVNEEAARRMGLESPVGKSFKYYSFEGSIIGVVADANYRSLHTGVEPHIFMVMRDIAQETTYGVVLIRIDGRHVPEAVAGIERVWNEVNTISPFEYHFLDDVYENLYLAETRMGDIIDAFTAFALLISCLGLYGLAAFMAESRAKEIGIRKVLGLSAGGVFVLQSAEITKCLLIANLIAWPVSYLVMKRVLETFAYRIDIGWGIFAVSGLVGFAVALLTMSHQTIKAATANPVEALRNE